MANLTVTRAEAVAVGSFPIGCDTNLRIVMDPPEDTSGWSVSCVLSLTKGGTSILTLTSPTQITVGGGDDGEVIEVDLMNVNTAALPSTQVVHFVVKRTDIGEHDRLAFGTLKPDLPSV